MDTLFCEIYPFLYAELKFQGRALHLDWMDAVRIVLSGHSDVVAAIALFCVIINCNDWSISFHPALRRYRFSKNGWYVCLVLSSFHHSFTTMSRLNNTKGCVECHTIVHTFWVFDLNFGESCFIILNWLVCLHFHDSSASKVFHRAVLVCVRYIHREYKW